MDRLGLLIKKIIEFRNKRDWKQFHNPKDLAISLSLESSEVLEHFQWKNEEEMRAYVKTHKKEIGEELADVLYWILLMGHDLSIAVFKMLNIKMKNNEEKYPVKKSKGIHTKYNKL
jgi:NTP pyrophosphatase (non-canonical NTP hydrolase)